MRVVDLDMWINTGVRQIWLITFATLDLISTYLGKHFVN
jgi:hypothetical protein